MIGPVWQPWKSVPILSGWPAETIMNTWASDAIKERQGHDDPSSEQVLKGRGG